MLLENKNAVIYGAGGAIGGATARAFAREEARVFLTAHHMAAVEAVAQEISAAGGLAETAELDTLDEGAVEEHLNAVIQKVWHIDISFNAVTPVPQPGVQGIPLTELSPESFTLPITKYSMTNFLTARAAARRMIERKSGVILTLTATPGRSAAPLVGGMAPAWAAIEALTRGLAAELGPHGVRVVCLRPAGLPETDTIGVVFGLHASALGMPREAFQALMEGQTPRRRLQTLAEVANVAAFIASDQASAMTGTVANLSSGSGRHRTIRRTALQHATSARLRHVWPQPGVARVARSRHPVADHPGQCDRGRHDFPRYAPVHGLWTTGHLASTGCRAAHASGLIVANNNSRVSHNCSPASELLRWRFRLAHQLLDDDGPTLH